MGRQPCCEKIGLKRGPWTIDEDQKLINFILNNGIQCWRLVPKLAGLMRCGKSCRLRWTNYLRPDLKRGALSEAEENQIIQLHSRLGNRWSKIAAHFPGRTDNEIKNHWNTRIKKRLKLLGLDPVTHKPIEQPKNCDTKIDPASQSNPCEEQKQKEKTLIKEATTSGHDHEDFRVASMKQEGSELGLSLSLDDTSTFLHSYGMLWESLEMEDLKPQANNACNSGITSFSLEDTLFPYMGEGSSPLLECSKLYWEDTVDSSIS